MEVEMTDKRHRTSMSGIPVMEQSSWGTAKARERYGTLKQTDMKAKDMTMPQARESQPSDKSYNDAPNDWRRGAGEDASGKPGYIRGRR
jgi:hypothetical protein